MELTAKLNGTGNVFDETHFSKATATRFKRHLAERLVFRMKAQKLTLKNSAEKAGCDVADIRDLRNSNVSNFEVSDLIGLARKFGFGVKVEVSVPRVRPQVH